MGTRQKNENPESGSLPHTKQVYQSKLRDEITHVLLLDESANTIQLDENSLWNRLLNSQKTDLLFTEMLQNIMSEDNTVREKIWKELVNEDKEVVLNGIKFKSIDDLMKAVNDMRSDYRLLKEVLMYELLDQLRHKEDDFSFANLKEHLSLKDVDLNYLSSTEDYNNEPVHYAELIWNYWLEEGMVSKSINVIANRFGNFGTRERDKLADLSLNPLRKIAHTLFNYNRDPYRIKIPQIEYECFSQYGYSLSWTNSNLSPTSSFHDAFCNLLIKCSEYYKERNNKIINADGFPVLNALREVHLALADGFHNQASRLTIEARMDTLLQLNLLGSKDVKDYLGFKPMRPYRASWMRNVDAMKLRQGWDNVSISYYYDLASIGETLIRSIRFFNWSVINNMNLAKTWADVFSDQIKRYVDSYRVVTGVNLSSESASDPQMRRLVPGALISRRRQLRP